MLIKICDALWVDPNDVVCVRNGAYGEPKGEYNIIVQLKSVPYPHYLVEYSEEAANKKIDETARAINDAKS